MMLRYIVQTEAEVHCLDTGNRIQVDIDYLMKGADILSLP